MNNVKKTISWADYTWNPITGCKRGCDYCYARRIHERFNDAPFTDIVFHADRLSEPSKIKKPSVIFVGSMSDITYWTFTQIKMISAACDLYDQHTYMFLTKSVGVYGLHDWAPNTMQGVTITQGEAPKIKAPRPYYSIEPLLGEITAPIPDCEKIIVGAMTGRGSVIPKKEWIDSVTKYAPKEKLFIKSNIKKYFSQEKEAI